MQLRYNFRVYPEPAQRHALARAFGCARVVFYDGLRARQEAHAGGSAVHQGQRPSKAGHHRREAHR
ncbi:helix-turn-helix domain-containing protein [Streptomyces sp. NPDC056254]|uniref:helix-turn-helix domain-containing protein n=1 Tax=Streptomyces sp. NPDC056254 TaxID=3345763 RepID=UPI0035E3AFFB